MNRIHCLKGRGYSIMIQCLEDIGYSIFRIQCLEVRGYNK